MQRLSAVLRRQARGDPSGGPRKLSAHSGPWGEAVRPGPPRRERKTAPTASALASPERKEPPWSRDRSHAGTACDPALGSFANGEAQMPRTVVTPETLVHTPLVPVYPEDLLPE